MSIDDGLAFVRGRLGGFVPDVAIVLGSGLGDLAREIEAVAGVPYADILDFPQSSVVGHAGQFIFGTLAGQKVACMQGRLHFYEGHPLADLAIPIRLLRRLGCQTLILTNAAGSLRAEVGPGSLMAISDHINFVGVNPLVGPNDEAVGPRFFDVSNAYDRELRALLTRTAAEQGIDLTDGVYAWYSGPNFETPAEICALRILGADAVGMSTVPECLVALHAGMRVVAVSIITNLAAGMTAQQLSHDETLENAGKAAANLAKLLRAFLRRL